MAKNEKKQNQNESQEQIQEQSQASTIKDNRYIYAGPTVINEKFFLRNGQIFTEVPLYVPEDLKPFFVPISEYSPEKEKELEKKKLQYLKAKKGGK